MFVESTASLTKARIRHNLKKPEEQRAQQEEGEEASVIPVKTKRHVLKVPESKGRKDQRHYFCLMCEKAYTHATKEGTLQPR